MSGGHFSYDNYLLSDIITELEYLIDINDSDEKDEYGDPFSRHYPPEIIEKFKEALIVCKKNYEMLHCIDYLLSDDYGEDSFIRNWEKRLKVIGEQEKRSE